MKIAQTLLLGALYCCSIIHLAHSQPNQSPRLRVKPEENVHKYQMPNESNTNRVRRERQRDLQVDSPKMSNKGTLNQYSWLFRPTRTTAYQGTTSPSTSPSNSPST